MGQKIAKARYWTAVLYPESMIEGWQDKISDILQIPFEYCIHDKDELGRKIKKVTNKYNKVIVYDASDFAIDSHETRKVHVHLIIVFNNTTTYKHALSVFQKLQPSCSYCEQVLSIRYIHEYLIHNTEKAKKENKHLYDVSERISGNNFDIGSYEQISITDKRKMLKELCDIIYDNCVSNFIDFYEVVVTRFDDSYFEVISSYSGLLERMCKGNYLKYHNK